MSQSDNFFNELSDEWFVQCKNSYRTNPDQPGIVQNRMKRFIMNPFYNMFGLLFYLNIFFDKLAINFELDKDLVKIPLDLSPQKMMKIMDAQFGTSWRYIGNLMEEIMTFAGHLYPATGYRFGSNVTAFYISISK